MAAERHFTMTVRIRTSSVTVSPEPAKDELPVPVLQIIPLIRRSVSAMISKCPESNGLSEISLQDFAEVEFSNTERTVTL